jgi:hypothetical protein
MTIGTIARGETYRHVGGPIRAAKHTASKFFGVHQCRDRWAAKPSYRGRRLYLGLYWHETQAALAVNDAITILALNKPLNKVTDEAVMSTSKMEEDQLRRETLRQDLSVRKQQEQGSAYIDHYIQEMGGRFSSVGAAHVVGSTPIPAYPAAAAHQRDPVGQEPPLSYRIDDLEQPTTELGPPPVSSARATEPTSARDVGSFSQSSGDPGNGLISQPSKHAQERAPGSLPYRRLK